MAISAIGIKCGYIHARASDSQVRTLKAKIQDWTDCPTTDATTMKAILGRLQVQLDSLTLVIQAKDDSKKSEAAGIKVSEAASNSRLDIRV